MHVVVQYIGEENTQLLLRIEHLKHLEERSALVYKDIDRFKQVLTLILANIKVFYNSCFMDHCCEHLPSIISSSLNL